MLVMMKNDDKKDFEKTMIKYLINVRLHVYIRLLKSRKFKFYV